LEKYHRDDNIAGMLVEYIDELERRHPTNWSWLHNCGSQSVIWLGSLFIKFGQII
jgi:hypothetical protein